MSDTAAARRALVEKFRSLALDRLDKLNRALLALERDPSQTALADDAMREIHTLKGEAKLMGFADVNLAAHRTEDLMIQLRRAGFNVTPEQRDLVLTGFDVIGALLQKEAGGGRPAVDLAAFVQAVDGALRSAPVEATPIAPQAIVERGEALRNLMRVGAETSLRVELRKLEQLTTAVGDLLLLQVRHEALLRQVNAAVRQSVEALRDLRGRLSSAAPAPDLDPSPATNVIAAQLDEASRRLAAVVAHRGALGLARDELFESHIRLDELASQVRGLRLLPLASLLERYPRAVRDLAREQHKQVEVEIIGGDVEVDKVILETISEPLLHLVRNAIDHGIEAPDERRRAGKPETGRLLLRAAPRGAEVDIVVADDGRGLDRDAIREAAVRRGLLTDAAAAGATAADLEALLFHPGFSTRAAATDVSGRGVGLDVVRKRIEGLGGGVQLSSKAGAGTSFRLTVPISFALKRVMVVRVGETAYALPSEAVVVAARIAPSDLLPAGRGRAARLEGDSVPLVDLGLALHGQACATPDGGDQRVVVIQSQESRVGLVVTDFVGERQVVQRNLDPFLAGARLVSASAALADGRILLLLNPNALLEGAAQTAPLSPAPARAPDAAPASVLVVDDSEVSRDLVAGTLRQQGYEVREAVNGQEALQQARERPPALVVTDLEMPICDGFALLSALRADPTLRDVPVIVLSTRGSDQDKQRAAALGADAYLVKTEFQEATLLRVVHDYLAR